MCAIFFCEMLKDMPPQSTSALSRKHGTPGLLSMSKMRVQPMFRLWVIKMEVIFPITFLWVLRDTSLYDSEYKIRGGNLPWNYVLQVMHTATTYAANNHQWFKQLHEVKSFNNEKMFYYENAEAAYPNIRYVFKSGILHDLFLSLSLP